MHLAPFAIILLGLASKVEAQSCVGTPDPCQQQLGGGVIDCFTLAPGPNDDCNYAHATCIGTGCGWIPGCSCLDEYQTNGDKFIYCDGVVDVGCDAYSDHEDVCNSISGCTYIPGGSSPGSSPTDSPPASDIPSQCVDAANAVSTCGSTQACYDCIGGALQMVSNEDVATCEEADTLLCGAINQCDTTCGTCEDEWENFIECLYEDQFPTCDFECTPGGGDDDGSGSGTDPDIPSQCIAASNALNACSATEECFECNVNAIETFSNQVDSVSTCEDANALLCGSVNQCDPTCGSCEDEMENFIECLYEDQYPTCNFECTPGGGGGGGSGTDPDIPSQCIAASNALNACGATEECFECNVNAIETFSSQVDSVSTCEDANALLCGSVNQCDPICGSCEDEMENFIECLYEDVSPNCDFECTPGGGGERVRALLRH